MGRFVILVDEDIDPSDLKDVFWAITSRCDPATQTQVMHDFPTSDINPRVAPEDRDAGRFVASRIVIDACRPFRWLKEFPATNVMSQEKKKQISAKWHGVLEKLDPSSGAERNEIKTNNSILSLWLTAFLLLFLSAQSFAQERPDARLIQGAEKEARLVWWTTTNLDLSQRILDRFEKKYPFIKPTCFALGEVPYSTRFLPKRSRVGTRGMCFPGAVKCIPPLMERSY